MGRNQQVLEQTQKVVILTVVVHIFSSFVNSREYLIIGCHNQLRGERERETNVQHDKQKFMHIQVSGTPTPTNYCLCIQSIHTRSITMMEVHLVKPKIVILSTSNGTN